MDTIPLRDAVRALRTELLEARQMASTEEVRFELGPIEMEFQVVAKREAGGEGKLGFHIFGVEATLSGSGKGADERTQKVKFVLNPIYVDPVTGLSTKLAIARGDEVEQKSASKQTLERR